MVVVVQDSDGPRSVRAVVQQVGQMITNHVITRRLSHKVVMVLCAIHLMREATKHAVAVSQDTPNSKAIGSECSFIRCLQHPGGN
jgi:hypothetical protein